MKKVSSTIEFCTFKLVKEPSFSLNWQFWCIQTDVVYVLKQKGNITIEVCIFKLVYVRNLTLKNFEFWDQIYPKRVFLPIVVKFRVRLPKAVTNQV